MPVMTVEQVMKARLQCHQALKKHGYDPALQISSKEQFIQVAQDVFSDLPHEVPGNIGLHVYNGTGGMFVGLLERIGDDGLRQTIIREVNQDDPDPSRYRAGNRYPGKLTAGQHSLLVLRSGCTTADISELGRIETGRTKYTDPAGLPDFMKSAAARGLFIGSRHAQLSANT
jgi:hypothetical protein